MNPHFQNISEGGVNRRHHSAISSGRISRPDRVCFHTGQVGEMTLKLLPVKLGLTFMILFGIAEAGAGNSAVSGKNWPISPLLPGHVSSVTHKIQSVQNDSAVTLNKLFSDLKGAVDETAASKIENKIWELWLRSGDDAIDKLMQQAIFFMNSGLFQDSLSLLNQIIDQKPEFSEAWNKRATVFYLMHRYEESMSDIVRVLELEPRHFGAISGIALISLARGDKKGALKAYRQAITIYPLMPGAAAMIPVLESEVEGLDL